MMLRDVLLLLFFSFPSITLAESLESKIKRFGICYGDEVLVAQASGRSVGGSLKGLIAAVNRQLKNELNMDPSRRATLIFIREYAQNCLNGVPQIPYEAALAKARGSGSTGNSSSVQAAIPPTNAEHSERQAETNESSGGQPIDQHGNPCITIKQLETSWVTASKKACYRISEVGNCQDRVDNYQAANGCNQTISFSVQFNQPTWPKGGLIKPGGHHKFSCSYGGPNTNNCKTYSWSASVAK